MDPPSIYSVNTVEHILIDAMIQGSKDLSYLINNRDTTSGSEEHKLKIQKDQLLKYLVVSYLI